MPSVTDSSIYGCSRSSNILIHIDAGLIDQPLKIKKNDLTLNSTAQATTSFKHANFKQLLLKLIV